MLTVVPHQWHCLPGLSRLNKPPAVHTLKATSLGPGGVHEGVQELMCVCVCAEGMHVELSQQATNRATRIVKLMPHVVCVHMLAVPGCRLQEGGG